jgi:long-chain acyl-CoA synthetase
MEMAADGLSSMWGYRADDVHLTAGPMYHAGPGGYAHSTLYVGGTVVLMRDWDAEGFLRLVEQHRVTTTFLTPAHFIRLLELPASTWAAYDQSSLRHVLHAGAPCPHSVKERIIAALPAAEVWELYGMSEGGATKVSSTDWLERPGTVGQPWPGVQIHVRDPDTGEEQPAGRDGIIWVTPAQGRFEYHNDPAKTAKAWRDGAFTVGDIGHLDDDGWLFLTDRQSDMIIRAGVNIYPREIENVLYQHPAVVDCAVFGVPHERDGEHPVAVVEVRTTVAVDELDRWCRERLDRYKVPSRIDLVTELPRDPNGKVLKRLLRDEAWAGTGRAI